MRTRNYSKINFIVKILFNVFSLNGNLFFLIVSLIMLARPSLSPFLSWIYIAPLGFYAICRVCKELFFNYQKVKFDNGVNKTKVKRLTFSSEGDGTEEVTWEKLEIGDAVCLRKGDYVPADMILLDSSERLNKENVCYASTKLINGKKNLVAKKAVKITKLPINPDSEPNFRDYKFVLSGTLEYENPSVNLNEFRGVLKLSKDPRPELLSNDNLLLKMSKVKNTNWMIGLAVYCGNQAKIMGNSDFLRRKPNFGSRITNKFNFVMIFIAVLFALISIVGYIGDLAVKEYIKSYEHYTDYVMFFYYLIQYANFVPLAIYFTLDLIEIIHFCKSRYIRNVGVRKHFITPYNTSALEDLGTIDYIITDTTSLSLDNCLRVQQLYIPGTLYTIQQEKIGEKVQIRSEKEFLSPSSATSQTSSVPSEVDDGKRITKKITELPDETDEQSSIVEDHHQEMTEGDEEGHLHKESEEIKETENDVSMAINLQQAILMRQESINSRGNLLQMQSQEDIEDSPHHQIMTESALPPSLAHLSETRMLNPVREPQKKVTEISTAKRFERGQSLKKSGEEEIKNYAEKETDGFVRDYFKGAHIENLLKCILLSSETRTVKENDVEKIVSNYQEDKVLLNFARSCQFSLEFITLKGKKSLTAMQIKTRNSMSQYNLLVQSASFSERKEKFSVVASTHKGFNTTVTGTKVIFGIENIDIDEAFIYTKGIYTKVRHLLKLKEKQATTLDHIAEKMYYNGKIPIVYARKKLKKEQTQELVKKYKNFKTNLNAQPETLEKMFEDIEKDLEFVGVCSLGQICITPIFDTVQTLNQAGINMWVVSNEPFEKILLLLRTYQILTESNNHFYIDGESQESIAISVRLHMGQVRRVFELEKQTLARENISQRLNVYYNSLSENILKRMSSYVIIVSGRAFEFIRNDKMTYDNFAFLCAISCRVIGYDFCSENKQALIRMAKKKFSDQTQVMAVGSTYTDMPMLNAADIGVFCTNFQENNFLPWADIKTSDMCNLPKLLLEQGVAFTHQIDHSIYYLFYKSVALTLPLFYYNWFCSMTGTSVYDSVVLFLFNFLFTILPILCLAVDQPFSKEYIQAFPAFYAESRYKKLHLVKKFILRVVVEGVVHATLVFYLSLYTISYSTDSHAYPGDLGMLSLSLIIALVFIVDFKTFFHITKSRLSLLGTIMLSLTMLFGFLWLNARAIFTDRGGAHIDLNKLIRQPTMIFMLLFVIFICLAFSYIINNYVVVSEVANAWQLLAYKWKKGKFKNLDNDEILNVLKYKEKQLSRVIKTVYKNSDKLENFVLEMLNMLGQNMSRINVKRFSLAFPDKILERRYQYNKIASSMWFVRFCYYVGTIIFIAASIIIVATQDSDNLNLSRFIAAVVLIVCCIYINTNYYKKHYVISNFVMLLLVITFKLCYDYIKEDDGSMTTAILILILSTFFLFEIYQMIILNLLLLIPFYIQQYNNYKDLPDSEQTFYIVFSNYLLLTSLAVVSIYNGLQLEKQNRNEFLASINIDTQNSTYDNILSILVPDFVKTLLNRGIRYLAEDQGQVAILFCDICDFDDVIRDRGTQVVEILDNLWRQFDKYCLEHGVQKIETVGKTYMACAGLKSTERDFSERAMTQNSTKRVVNMAIDMMNYVEETTLEGMSLRIKIGVHYGRVIAGIIGEHKPQFSLIGDTVNTTSRVCSTGEKGKIILSQEAFQEVKTRALTFIMREVEAKGKGKIKTYIIQRERRQKKHAERADRGRNEVFRTLRTLVNPDAMFDSSRMDDSSMSSHLIALPQQEIVNSATVKDEARNGDVLPMENMPPERANVRKKSVNVMLKKMFKASPAKEEHETSKEELEKDGVENRIQLLQASRFLLLVRDSPIKRMYKLQKLRKYRSYVNTCLLSLAVIVFLQTLITLITRNSLDITATFIAVRSIFSGYLILLVLFNRCFEKHEWLERLLLFIGLLYGCLVLIYQSYNSPISNDWYHKVDFLEITIVLVMGLTCRKFEFVHCLLFYLVLTPIYMIFWSMNPHVDYNYLFYYYTIALYILVTQYIVQQKDISSFNLGLKQNQRYYEQNSLISQLLPIHALDKLLRATEFDLTDLMDDTTLLFSDISGFTKFSSSREPEEVVAMLTEMFTEFDKMCIKLGVYKVYTIGDAYIVMGFTNANDRNPEQEAHNVVKMGMAMIDIIRAVREKLGYKELEMRIGIHTGTVIGGIIGTDIVRYDLYGKDYLIGNKMESNGKEGMIQVSETTKRILEKAFPHLYRFEKHKDIEIPTLGEKITGYLVYADETEHEIETDF